MGGLEELYRLKLWPMYPDEPAAVRRFEAAQEVFRYLVDNHQFLRFLKGMDEVWVVEVAAGTGIGGAAFSKVLAELGYKVYLTISDVRAEDLRVVHDWLKGVSGVEVETLVCDASELHRHLKPERYDIALMWGLSTPHFDPWQMALVYASLSSLLGDHGVMLFDEVDRVFRVMYQIGYKDFLVEAGRGDLKLVSIHVGYDMRRGVFRRAYYMLPGFKEVSELPTRFWDLAGVAVLGWMFFRKVDIVLSSDHGVPRIPDIVLLSEPRRAIRPGDLEPPNL